MATSQQATFAAGQQKNWAQPGDPNFGQPGYMGQSDYDSYTQQQGTPQARATTPTFGSTAQTPTANQSAAPPPSGPSYGAAPAPAAQPTQGGQPPVPPTPKPAAPPGVTMVPTQDGQGWVPDNSPLAWKPAGAAPAAAAPPGAAPPAGTPASGSPVPGSGPGSPANPADPTGAAGHDFLNTLLGLMHPGTVTQEDPAISGAIAANNLALQRGAEAQRAQQAEVNAATGEDASGGANTLNQGILEDMAAKQGQFAGQEVQGLQQQQNQNRLAAIGAIGGYLPQQQQMANQFAEHEASLSEQAREADVDAALQKLGITTQGNLGAQDIALRDKIASSQAGLQLLGLLMQGSEFGASMDSSTMLGLLNSLGA